jgi:hypothetical protein
MDDDSTRPGLARRALFLAGILVVMVVVVLASGTIVGRWRFVTPDEIGPAVPVSRADLVVVVPVPAATLRAGDVVYVRPPDQPGMLVRIDGVVDPRLRTYLIHGETDAAPRKLPETVWRQRRALPAAGVPFRALAGPVPTLVLALTGVALVAGDLWQRRRRDASAPVPATPATEDPETIVPAAVTLGFIGVSTDPDRRAVDASRSDRPRR